MAKGVTIFWFRRDLRLIDNVGLHWALKSSFPVIPLFIFDDEILEKLPRDDARVSFIHKALQSIHEQLLRRGSSLLVKKGKPIEVWHSLVGEFEIEEVYCNHDYEPYAIARDKEVSGYLKTKGIAFKTYKDQVIFEKGEILKDDGTPYTVYTPYKNKWLQTFRVEVDAREYEMESHLDNLKKVNADLPKLKTLGFEESTIKVKPYDLSVLDDYEKNRDFPGKEGTTQVSPYLRFGLLSIRELVRKAHGENSVYLSELIWREFFMQILFHFPYVVNKSFKPRYDAIKWRNNEQEFELWCKGETGYPLVDAGMRELNDTGYMHNRVRMVVASFLCKHLLIEWKWGEAYFAEKLLDYELSSNNGNWQWVAGTGCDAAPYFRIFNPSSQLNKFDKNFEYTKQWVPEFQESTYPKPIVEHGYARLRALDAYKKALNTK